MDVTKSNFQTVLEALDDELKNASFVSIDTEFTGLSSTEGRNSKLSSLDTPPERYKKVLNGTSQFVIIQFGLSIFRFDNSISKYVNKTYNFYIFPNTSTLPGLCDTKFLSQASSLGFLASQGFDFNKLIKEGIPYLNLVDEEKLKVILEKKSKLLHLRSDASSTQVSELPADQKGFLNNITSKVETFLQNEENEEKSNAALELHCSTIQNELIFSHVKYRYPKLLFEISKKTSSGCTVIVKKTGIQNSKTEPSGTDNNVSEMEKFEDNVGFSRVIRKITDSGKLVVGHNMLLDLCHILGQFCAPLPEDYHDFKGMVNTFFPRFIDTKVMATTKPFRDILQNSALERLLSSLLAAPFRSIEIVPATGFPSYTDNFKNHEAGYDAFITGRCFLAMANYLEDISSSQSKTTAVHESSFITPFYQKIFMMMVPDIPYMTISGPDLEPSREHVFHVTFPSEWKLQDIFHLFSVHGTVRVDWTGDTSAFVTLHRKENSPFVLRAMAESKLPVGCSVISYKHYLDRKSQNATLSAEVPDLSSRKRLSSAVECNSCDFPSPKKIRKDVKNVKLNKEQFVVSADWD
ncbi:poly(A)-specific ribonuclease PARN-like [Daphnia carinata]|uniref:poly(A)-specific ribonuclease PARN-like n=1 Tax=Daphnia carinata TaxID=120202 RepID=UPI00257AFA42|nr:poly(A)-specific ribonuclease PARN-like [Daphnia carinata]